MESTTTGGGIPGVNIGELKARLNTIAQEIHYLNTSGRPGSAASSKEVAKCISQFTQFFEEIAEQYGTHPQHLLGQHVCCNALMLVMEKVVKPALTQYSNSTARRAATAAFSARAALTASSSSAAATSAAAVGAPASSAQGGVVTSDDVMLDAKARQLRHDTARPFRVLLQTLHKHLPLEPRGNRPQVGGGGPRTLPTAPSSRTADHFLAFASATVRGGALPRPSALPFDDPVSAPAHHSSEDIIGGGGGGPDCQPAAAVSVAPLLWKGASPLVCVCNHLLEVLQSEVLAPVIGQDYANMLRDLMQLDGYARQFTSNYIVELSDRLLVLLERVELGAAPLAATSSALASSSLVVSSSGRGGGSAGSEVVAAAASTRVVLGVEDGAAYAALLAQVFMLPQAAFAFCSGPSGASINASSSSEYMKNGITSVTSRLIDLVARRHRSPSSGLRLEAYAVRALRCLVTNIQHDHPQAARAPLELVRLLSDVLLLPDTGRKEVWVVEVLIFITSQICLNLSGVLGTGVRVDLQRVYSASGGGGEDEGIVAASALNALAAGAGAAEIPEGVGVAPRAALRVLHETVLPMALHLFTLPRHDFSLVSRRELFHSPCPALDDVFSFGALVVYLSCATHKQYIALAHAAVAPPQSDATQRGRRARVEMEGNDQSAMRAQLDSGHDGDRASIAAPAAPAAAPDPMDLVMAALQCEFNVGVGVVSAATSTVGGGGHHHQHQQPTTLLTGWGTASPSVMAGLTAATERPSVAAIQDMVKDAALLLLHLLAQPCTTLHCEASRCDAIVERYLLPLFLSFGTRLGPLLLTTVTAVAPRCGAGTRHRLFEWVVRRFIPSPNTHTEDDIAPREAVYKLLATLAEMALLREEGLFLIGSPSATVAPDPESHQHPTTPPPTKQRQRHGARVVPGQEDEVRRRLDAGTHYAFISAQVRARVQTNAVLLEQHEISRSLPPHSHSTRDRLFNLARSGHSRSSVGAAVNSICTPDLAAAMVRFIACYEGCTLLSLLGSTDRATAAVMAPVAPALSELGASVRLGGAGLDFVCDALTHGCCFHPTGRGTGATTSSDEQAYREVLLHGERYALARVLAHSVQRGHAATTSLGLGERLRGRALQLLTRWTHQLETQLRSPYTHVPPVAMQAAEPHWLLLAGGSSSSSSRLQGDRVRYSTAGLSDDDSTEQLDDSATSVRYDAAEIPESFSTELSQSVVSALLCLCQRSEMALQEATLGPAASTVAAARPPSDGRHGGDYKEEASGPGAVDAVAVTASVDEDALTTLHVTICVQSVQLIHFLMRLHACGLWRTPEEHRRDGSYAGAAVQPNLQRPRQPPPPGLDEDDVVVICGGESGGDTGDDCHVLSTDPDLLRHPARVLSRLSPDGRIYFALLWCCELLSTRLLRAPLVAYAPSLRALVDCMTDVGASLLSPSVACAEPRHIIPRMAGILCRRLLTDGVRGLPQWRPVNATSEDVAGSVLGTLSLSLSLLRVVLLRSHRAGLLQISTDPLVSAEKVCRTVAEVLAGEGLLTLSTTGTGPSATSAVVQAWLAAPVSTNSSDAAVVVSSSSSSSSPFTPFTLPVAEAMMGLLQTLSIHFGEQAARRIAWDLTATLFVQYRFNMAESILHMVARAGSEASSHWRYAAANGRYPTSDRRHHSAAAAPPRGDAALDVGGLILERIADQLTDLSRVDMPVFSPPVQCALLTAIFSLLPICEPTLAEKLGKRSFNFLTEKTPYVVRRHAAGQVGLLFRLFSQRAEGVLHELLFRSRGGILTDDAVLCATSMRALSEAALAAPWLESAVVHTLLECWATRHFRFKGLVLECLERIAVGADGNSGDKDRAGGRRGVPAHAQLCRYHLPSLLFRWVWCAGHPVEAIPAPCFGYDTVEALLADHLHVAVPLSLLLISGRGGGDAEVEERTGEEAALLEPSALYKQLVDIFYRHMSVNDVGRGRKSNAEEAEATGAHHRSQKRRRSDEEDEGGVTAMDSAATPLRAGMDPLLTHFPRIVAQLAVWSLATTPTGDFSAVAAGTSSSRQPRRSMEAPARPPHRRDDNAGTGQGRPTDTDQQRLAHAADVALYWLEHTLNQWDGGDGHQRAFASHLTAALAGPSRRGVTAPQGDSSSAPLYSHGSTPSGGVAAENFVIAVHLTADAILCALTDLLGTDLPYASEERLRMAADALFARIPEAAFTHSNHNSTDRGGCNTDGALEPRWSGRVRNRGDGDGDDDVGREAVVALSVDGTAAALLGMPSRQRSPLDQVLIQYDGDCVFTVLQYVYADIALAGDGPPPRPMHSGRKLELLERMCTRWVCREALCLPHVFHTIITVCVNLLLSASSSVMALSSAPVSAASTGISAHVIYSRVCAVLLHVWPMATSSVGDTQTRSRLVEPHDATLAATMLMLAPRSPVVSSTWVALCRSDKPLMEKDWQLLSAQFSAEVTECEEEVTEGDVVEAEETDARGGATTGPRAHHRAQHITRRSLDLVKQMLPLLRSIPSVVAGGPSTYFFAQLTQAVDAERAALALCIRAAATKARHARAAGGDVSETYAIILDDAEDHTSRDVQSSAASVEGVFAEQVSKTCQLALTSLFAACSQDSSTGKAGRASRSQLGQGCTSGDGLLAALNLMRSLSWCYIDSGEACRISFDLFHPRDAWSGVATVAVDFVSAQRPDRSGARGEVALLVAVQVLGRGYAQLTRHLHSLAFHPDSHMAQMASWVLREWLAEDADGAVDEQSDAHSSSRCGVAAGADVGAGDRKPPLQQQQQSRPLPTSLDAALMWLVRRSWATMSLTAVAEGEEGQGQQLRAALRPFYRASTRPAPTAAASARARSMGKALANKLRGKPAESVQLLDSALWRLLSADANERAFLPLFTIAAINTHGLAAKLRMCRAAIPLLVYEAQAAVSSRSVDLRFAESMLPLVLCHMLTSSGKETEGQRDRRAQWCSLLSEHLLSFPERFPVATRALLQALHMYHCILLCATRHGGLKGYKPPTAATSATLATAEDECSGTGPAPAAAEEATLAHIATLFGSIAVVADMRECYWLADIPASQLARAAVAVQEPYLSHLFAEIAGESLLRARGGIPAGPSIAAGQLTMAMMGCGGGDQPGLGRHGSASSAVSTLFPLARGAAARRYSAGTEEARKVTARPTREQERSDQVAHCLRTFYDEVRPVFLSAGRMMLMEGEEREEEGGDDGYNDGTAAGRKHGVTDVTGWEQQTWSSLSSSWPLALRSLDQGLPGDAAGQLDTLTKSSTIAKARVLLNAGLPRTAMEVLTDGSVRTPQYGPDGLQQFVSHVPQWTADEEAALRAALAEAAWQCGQWYRPSSLMTTIAASEREGAADRYDGTNERDERSPVSSLVLRCIGNRGVFPSRSSYHEALLHAMLAAADTHDDPAALPRAVKAAQGAVQATLQPATWWQSVVALEAIRDVRECGLELQRLRKTGGADPSATAALPPPRWLRAVMDDDRERTGGDQSGGAGLRVPYRRWVLLDSVRVRLCQIYSREEWWGAQLRASAGRALAEGLPHLAYNWVGEYVGQLTRACAAEPRLLEAQLERRATDESGACDRAVVDLALLYAQSLYALGKPHEAVAGLQTAAVAATHHSPPSGPGGRDAVLSALFSLPAETPLMPQVVHQLVLWSREMRLVPLSQLVRDPFLTKASLSDTTGGCVFQLGFLCHTLAKDIAARLRTFEFKQLRKSIAESTRVKEALERQVEASTSAATNPPTTATGGVSGAAGVLSREEMRLIQGRIRVLRREIAAEEEEVHREVANYALYRRSALNAYARYLQLAGSHHHVEDVHAAFLFAELWLGVEDDILIEQGGGDSAGGGSSSSEVTQQVLRKAIAKTPSRKFLPLFQQLAAQLGSSVDAERVEQLVSRVAADHPLQTVWPLLALSNGRCFGDTREVNTMHTVDERKVYAAQRVLQRVKGDEADARGGGGDSRNVAASSSGTSAVTSAAIVRDAEKLSAAYIELAFVRPANASGTAHRIPSELLIMEGLGSLCIPPPTVATPFALPVKASYSGPAVAPTVMRFLPEYTTPGGINLPKAIRCELSNGHVVRQLLKSNDDLRQDALIEQVFAMANTLFLRSAVSRGLRVFTYNVTPLAPRVGVLQWVEHTVPLGDYLTGGSSGAHERYFPGELTTRECRARLTEATKDQKAVTLLSLYANFSPALHYFFLEKFPSPQMWLERGLMYARSVAAASMVGFIVGLGDRHGSNLLMHTQTGEMVHIDLGIAFDQNKLLPVPELVPFRLTRNVVDALGVRGVEGGGFRGHCAAALGTLRRNKDLLLTILSAFVHDPLARWVVAAPPPTTSTATRPRHGQGMDGADRGSQHAPTRSRHTTPADAQRTLTRVAAKLHGLDGGEQLSVPAQIQKLLHAAQSVDNLSAMFPGWSPWL